MHRWIPQSLALGLVVAGCSAAHGDYCEAGLAKALACAKNKASVERSKDEAMKQCRTEKRAPEFEAAGFECLAMGCDEYRDCFKRLHDKTLVGRIADATRTGEQADAILKECDFKDPGDPTFTGPCRDLAKTVLAAKKQELTAARDGGGGEASERACFDAMGRASRFVREEGNAFKDLCGEIRLATVAARTLGEVQSALDSGVYAIPAGCRSSMRTFDGENSGWARAKLQEIVRRCYVDLGKKIFLPALPKIETCAHEVKEIYETIKRYDLKDPELDGVMAEADRKCRPVAG